VHEEVLRVLEYEEKVVVYVVWTAPRPGDDPESALAASAPLTDPRVHFFWDPAGALGHAYGEYIPLPGDDTFAWDVFFLYHRLARWGDDVPPFMAWWHKFADDERTLEGIDVCREVQTLLGHEGGCGEAAEDADALLPEGQCGEGCEATPTESEGS
jgi:hypothetical protein